MSQHTKGQLWIHPGSPSVLRDHDGTMIAQECGHADAARLCRAWNFLDSYDEMRGALCDLYSYMDGYLPNDRNVNLTKYMENARAILKKTGEGK